MRLVDHAKQHLIVVPIGAVGGLIAEGHVRIDGRVGAIDDPVPPGAAVTVDPAAIAALALAPEATPLVIVQETDEVIVVDKPSGMHVHPLGPFKREPYGKDGLILDSGGRWLGPGHNAIVRDDNGKAWSLFHAYDDHQGIPRCAPKPGQSDNNQRHLLAAPVTMKNGYPFISAKL